MLISYKKKFIYIQVWKTGSTSLESALSPYSYQFDEYERIMRFVSRKFKIRDWKKWKVYLNTHKHSSAEEVSKIMDPDIFNSYYKFCFVRNPFDWLVSQYKNILDTPGHRHYELAKYLGSFEKYTRWRIDSGHKVLQKSWMCNLEGVNMVDFIGRFERLQEDLGFLEEKLSLKITLPHLNKTKGGSDYRKFYQSKEFIDFVVVNYIEDFEYFKYKTTVE